MGLLNSVGKEALGRLRGKNLLLDVVLGLINDPNTGGLSGLIENFKAKGLGGANMRKNGARLFPRLRKAEGEIVSRMRPSNFR